MRFNDLETYTECIGGRGLKMPNINLKLKKELFVPKFFPMLFDYSHRWEIYMGSAG